MHVNGTVYLNPPRCDERKCWLSAVPDLSYLEVTSAAELPTPGQKLPRGRWVRTAPEPSRIRHFRGQLPHLKSW